MAMGKIKNIFILILFLLPFLGYSQKDKLELVQADVLEGRGKVRVLKGNVIFKQDGSLMYTDSAYFYPRKNALDAFGKVRIVQPEGATITSRKLFYNGNTKLAKFRGNVVLVDKTLTVTTDALDYNMDSKQAVYNNGATIVDPPNTLKSRLGNYDANSKVFDFKENVKVENVEEDFTLYSQHLLYNSETKIATFLGPSTIISKGDTIFAESGTYNTTSKVSTSQNSQIISGDYVISGDQIKYNKLADRGEIKGNVVMFSERDSVEIRGNESIHRGDLGYTKVFGDAVMIQISNGDSLFLNADTLVSVDKKETTGEKKLLAYYNSKVYKKDLQAVADSIVYDFKDSVISFYTQPVIWSVENQILADTIFVHLVNNQLDKMYLRRQSFLISQDTLKNFNQVKGRDMEAWFKNDSIRRVDVNGNSQCIYFVLEGDTVLTGMNKVISSDMRMLFEENKVKTISFLKQPEGAFFPPHLIQEPDTRLKGFKWWYERRPSKDQVFKHKL